MPENLADSTIRLQRLVRQIVKETDPVKYSELGSEIWRVLDERARIRGAIPWPNDGGESA